MLILFRELWLNSLLGRNILELSLVDEVDGTDKVHVVLIDESGVLSELHQISRGEQMSQFIERLLILCGHEFLDYLTAGHLHGIEAITFLNILSQSVCKLGIVLLRILRGNHLIRLYLLNLLQCLLMRQEFLDYTDMSDYRLIVS